MHGNGDAVRRRRGGARRSATVQLKTILCPKFVNATIEMSNRMLLKAPVADHFDIRSMPPVAHDPIQ